MRFFLHINFIREKKAKTFWEVLNDSSHTCVLKCYLKLDKKNYDKNVDIKFSTHDAFPE